MQKISPFLWFDDQAEEAAKFYVSVFSGGRRSLRGRGFGGPERRPLRRRRARHPPARP